MKQKEKTKIETLPVMPCRVQKLDDIKASYFFIPFKVPTLNDFIKQTNNNRFTGSKLKKETQEQIAWYIYTAQNNSTLKPLTIQPLYVYFTWYEVKQNRDADNIQAGQKFILDAMQAENIIPNDNQKVIKNTFHRFVKSSDYGCLVELVEAQDKKRLKDIFNEIIE